MEENEVPSEPKQSRWRNTAQWCRNTLVNEGLLKKDSPWGSGRYLIMVSMP
jgi:restriction system protein